MIYTLLADSLLFLHLGFILFVGFGAVMVFHWPRISWIHIPSALWGAWIEFSGWICPLTPLENRLRQMGGAVGYSDGFIEHYVLPLIYPLGLTRGLQIGLGVLVLAINVTAYGFIAWRWSGIVRRP